jgi:hypothetical protein
MKSAAASGNFPDLPRSRRHVVEGPFDDENEPFWRRAERVELDAIDPDPFRGFNLGGALDARDGSIGADRPVP